MTRAGAFLRYALRRHPVVMALLAVALVALGMLLAGLISEALQMLGPVAHDRPLEPWMSPRLVGHAWGLPKPVVLELMGIDPNTPPHAGPRTLAEVMAREGLTLAELQDRVAAAAALLRESRP